ncbi:MAG TPA: dihydropteroate synthase [Accumulibacter sp.]|uniref:dihydropteroate synthase n=1 Tax=Accumulibacter sp. TaxID=2053492 RepID=UPI002879A756|nr:dihydropteroate synthase [Accumulibacter sp.]MDS4054726.1 dihydropteroate synthase [Accumulibacter sp.]HMV06673.1 dihydropteroate synthase [Accumulibacter sp.]HMW65010.1 dihydropteroate synthase [Accumulibacter sp.]HMW81810.1 dihydropteroate synthase [Accumulibacter sp.]HMX69166.1 dihydropteroate synthase [Accumulibacter sp.]
MLRCGSYTLDLSRPLVMGIVNLTPDSFSGDGLADDVERAVDQAYQQIAAGADILDLGAESSRPGAIPATVDEELRRLLPVLEALADCGVPLSIDTYKPEVMRASLARGASMINDIYALRMPGAAAALADSDCAVCLMHMQGDPLTMQQQPSYGDVVAEVRSFLRERADAAIASGIQAERLVLDPGFCFGKTLAHNLELLCNCARLSPDGMPILAGISRKSMLGMLTGQPVEQRLAASLSAAVLAVQRGVGILRVHDVAETVAALAVWQAVEACSAGAAHLR